MFAVLSVYELERKGSKRAGRLARRAPTFGLAIVMLLVALGRSASPALAGTCAQNALPDLETAVAAADQLPTSAHKTITVCPGTHEVFSTLAITTSNLSIRGKPGAVVTVPEGWTWSVITVSGANRVTLRSLTIRPGAGYDGDLIVFHHSSNVTVQKLVIDGGGVLGDDNGSTALALMLTGGKLSNNTILGWHSPMFQSGSTAIDVAGDTIQSVRITGNTITDFEGTGIQVADVPNVTVSGNRLTSLTANPRPVAQNGITLNGVAGGLVSGNRLAGGGFPVTDPNNRGMDLLNSTRLKVTGNLITQWTRGIDAGGCDGITDSSITGNTVRETMIGIAITAVGGCQAAETVDRNRITGNHLSDTLEFGLEGILIEVGSSGGFIGTARDEVIQDNAIDGFGRGLAGRVDDTLTTLPDPDHFITGLFTPNVIHIPPV
jgi:nitrous oxidase accessory protein NosD